jgi:predicted DNA-binding protein
MKNEQMKQMKEFREALELAQEALKDAIPFIDELNGRLEELSHHRKLAEATLCNDSLETLEEVEDFYIKLPVWDCMEVLSKDLKEVEDEVEYIIER